MHICAALKVPTLTFFCPLTACSPKLWGPLGNRSDIVLPTPNSKLITNNLSHVWHLFVIRSKERDRLQKYLAENGIQTLIHYPIPPHKQLAYKEWNELTYPITEKVSREVVSLPINPIMFDYEINDVVDKINNLDF